jgi:hypothetical protein
LDTKHLEKENVKVKEEVEESQIAIRVIDRQIAACEAAWPDLEGADEELMNIENEI